MPTVVLSHPLTPEAKVYVDSMTPQQLQLHQLAIEKLGSSYFVEKTHGFKEYQKKAAKGNK
jgi:hypothetical protein